MSHSHILDLPHNAIIPYSVQIDKNLSDAAKIYYGQIMGLAKKEGYIYATDDQLAEMKGVSVRNIERWNMQLEKCGHLRRITHNEFHYDKEDKKQWRKHRKIFLCNPCFKEKIAEPPKMAVPIEPAKNGGSKGSIINKQAASKQDIAAAAFLDPLPFSPEEKRSFAASFTQDQIARAIRFYLAKVEADPLFKPDRGWVPFLAASIHQDWPIPIMPIKTVVAEMIETQEASNRKVAEKFYDHFAKIFGLSTIEFITKHANCLEYRHTLKDIRQVIYYNSPKFHEELMLMAEKIKHGA